MGSVVLRSQGSEWQEGTILGTEPAMEIESSAGHLRV